MIAPMRKFAFLIHSEDYHGFLEELRSLGVLHVQVRKDFKIQDEPDPLENQIKTVESALKLVKKRIVHSPSSANIPESGAGLADTIWNTQEHLDSKKQKLHLLQKELQSLAPWGDFENFTIAEIANSGWTCSFFTCPLRKFQQQWLDIPFLFPIHKYAPDAFFVVFHPSGTPPEIDAEQLPPPAQDPAQLRLVINETRQQIDELEQTLDGFSARIPNLSSYLAQLREERDKAMVVQQTTSAAEDALKVLEGYVPKEKEGFLVKALESKPIVFWATDPTPEDAPPILLKNNRYSRLFEPISKLFDLPNYRELDLTPFFAPFFMLFFGFCLGDAGYGLAILLGTLAYRLKAKPELIPLLTLAHYLGGATILFGLLTGTIFGINLMETEATWLAQWKKYILDGQGAFNLALLLGLIQTLFGLGLQAYNRARQNGFTDALPPMGWILLLAALLDIGMFHVLGFAANIIAWVAVAFIVVFSLPGGSLFGRLGKGLWDLYGITGFFGDLLSYVRLFALGISSAILGYVINDIAFQFIDVLPVIGPILFVLFLIIGHTANLLLAMLGSFVHPLRLTFVEFYKNAGFSGGGKAYSPFAKRENLDSPSK
jgi:V/A-type H+-transporting ATPase subunit I